MRKMIDSCKQVFRDILFPRDVFCSGCGKLIRPVDRSAPEGLCRECATELHRLILSPYAALKEVEDLKIACAFPHEGLARHLVLRLKHGTVAQTADLLVPFLARTAQDMLMPDPDTIVTWVSMPGNRLRERAIDHGRLLAEGLAEELGLECRKLLVRKPGGHTQQGLNREQRLQNVVGRFSAVDGPLPDHVLIVDDVATTGSTLNECRRVLTEAGVRDVRAVTVCKV